MPRCRTVAELISHTRKRVYKVFVLQLMHMYMQGCN